MPLGLGNVVALLQAFYHTEPGGIPSTAIKMQFPSMNPCMQAGTATLDHLQVLPPFEIYVECYSNDTGWCLGKITAVKRMYIECIHRPYST